MSRLAREKSETGVYHIFFRGVNRQNIFEEEIDYNKLSDLLIDIKEEREIKIFAYCFLSNHVHLLVQEMEAGHISAAMHKVLTIYAGWFNKKYSRSGTLFGNRFSSEPVEDERHLITLVRYIHQNPQKAGIVNDLKDYKWSSYIEYTGIVEEFITDTDFLVKLLSVDENKAREVFVEIHHELVNDNLEIKLSRRKTESQIRSKIKELLKGEEPHTLGAMPKEERNNYIKILREKEGFSIRQIERATGISRGVISRV